MAVDVSLTHKSPGFYLKSETVYFGESHLCLLHVYVISELSLPALHSRIVL